MKKKVCGYPIHPRLGLSCAEPVPCEWHGDWKKALACQMTVTTTINPIKITHDTKK